MTVRHRNQDLRTVTSGSYFYYAGSPQTLYFALPHGVEKVCDDVVGNFPNPNPFDSKSTFTFRPTLSGELRSTGPGAALLRKFVNMPSEYTFPTNLTAGRFPDPTISERNNYGLEILAKANPNAPHVSVPTFIAELKDVPSLFQSWGNSLIGLIARSHLVNQWAVKPMVSDVKKMLSFVQAVEQRVRMMNHLLITYKGKRRPLRRRVSLGKTVITVPQAQVTIQSRGDLWTAWKTETHTSEMWGTVQYYLDSASSIPETDMGKLILAQRLCAGVTTFEAISTLWEILPWSWLVDWFLKIGTVIQALNNTIPFTYANVCLMRTTISKLRYELKTSGTWSTINGMPRLDQTRKQRWLSAPFLPVALPVSPIITGRRWSILGSLAILSVDKRNRLFSRLSTYMTPYERRVLKERWAQVPFRP